MARINLPFHQHKFSELYWSILTSKCEEISIYDATKRGIIRIIRDESESGRRNWTVTIEVLNEDEIACFIEEKVNSMGEVERKMWTLTQIEYELGVEDEK
jgi:hypothetical protein